ncbi:MAG: hypothetical protein HMLKMBBP_01101 [Planctomycetes bacterium]|nr:hypothetical protein [Planctomycetota bacterium]
MRYALSIVSMTIVLKGWFPAAISPHAARSCSHVEIGTWKVSRLLSPASVARKRAPSAWEHQVELWTTKSFATKLWLPSTVRSKTSSTTVGSMRTTRSKRTGPRRSSCVSAPRTS